MIRIKDLYGFIRNHKLTSTFMTGTILGLSIGGDSTIYSASLYKGLRDKTDNLVRVENIVTELNGRTLPFENLDDLTRTTFTDSVKSYVINLKSEKDSIEALPSYDQERTNYNTRLSKHSFYGNLAMGGLIFGAFSAVFSGLSLIYEERDKT